MRLMEISNYLFEFLRITRSCIMTPDAFFREIKDEEKRYLKPLAYGLISIGVNLIGCLLVYFFLPRSDFNQIDDIILFFSKVVLIPGFFLIFVLTPVARLFGGKGNFTQTYNVICYSVSVLNFSWIFVVLMMLITQLFRDTELIALSMFFLLALLLLDSFQYIIYLLIKRISITSDINKSEWVQEWKIPVNSGDKDDIFVNKNPSVLGFSIINDRAGEGGILPSTAYRSDPQTWARLNIVE